MIERLERCPRCNSPDPKRHPAMQFEGEVQICTHAWHGPALPQETRSHIGVEALADWFYDNGHEFVLSDEEDVARALIDSFEIKPKDVAVPRPERREG